MTIATLTEVLTPAMREGYAVAGLVVLGYEDARAYVEAADETGIPVILQAGPGCRKYTPTPILGKMFRTLAESARVPVVCHVDHAYTADECFEGIDCGFTSVMIDGSKLPLDKNISLTQQIVARAKSAGVSVEGEVGIVGYVKGAGSQTTSPAAAQRYDAESGADALAISIGNIHLSTEKTAGIPTAMRQKLACESRICKFNIGTELRMAFGRALRKSLADKPAAFDRIEILSRTIAPVQSLAETIITALRFPVPEAKALPRAG
jgi:fructose-bisphosphate aldolase, class II